MKIQTKRKTNWWNLKPPSKEKRKNITQVTKLTNERIQQKAIETYFKGGENENTPDN